MIPTCFFCKAASSRMNPADSRRGEDDSASCSRRDKAYGTHVECDVCYVPDARKILIPGGSSVDAPIHNERSKRLQKPLRRVCRHQTRSHALRARPINGCRGPSGRPPSRGENDNYHIWKVILAWTHVPGDEAIRR